MNNSFSAHDLQHAYSKMILSVSGLRAIFSDDGNEDSISPYILPQYAFLAYGAGRVFGLYLKQSNPKPSLLLGQDSRPTGTILAQYVSSGLSSVGVVVDYLATLSIPQLLAHCQQHNHWDGFFYISASHNPSGYNGFKFGLSDGEILGGEASQTVIHSYRQFIEETIAFMHQDIYVAQLPHIDTLLPTHHQLFIDSQKTYHQFILDILFPQSHHQQFTPSLLSFKSHLQKHPIGIVIDYNGSSRILSRDGDFLRNLGCQVYEFNQEVGQFSHRIVPEGEGLVQCQHMLQKYHQQNASYVLGYVPDCDGDRGNLVYIDAYGQASPLMAQSGFALCVLSELLYLYALGYNMQKVAVVANDATSLRIQSICQVMQTQLFTVETGEANVVGRAKQLRAQGYQVRIFGEGSNGGNITYPSTGRDPLNTLMSILKLFYMPINNSGQVLASLWFHLSGQPLPDHLTLPTLLDSLPQYCTTSAFETEALMHVSHSASDIKSNYAHHFTHFWPKLQKLWSLIDTYQVISYDGTEDHPDIITPTNGGLRIILLDAKKVATGFLWLRGSKTEPVMRVMVDINSNDKALHDNLMQLHKTIVELSDK